MLRRLSGQKHEVCTGVCIAGPGEGVRCFHGVTQVFFRKLSGGGYRGVSGENQSAGQGGGVWNPGSWGVDR